MRVRLAGLFLALFVIAITSGCVMESPEYQTYRADREVDARSFLEHYADAWADWFCDLSDVLSLEVAAGEGLGAYVQPTELGMAGVLYDDVMKFGYRQRGLGWYREVHKEGGASWFYWRELQLEPIKGTPALFRRENLFQDFTLRHNSDRHWSEIGLEFHVVFVGMSAFVNPKEIFDFAGSTLMLPYDVLLRGSIDKWWNLRVPEFDMSDDDKESLARKRHNVELINAPEGFAPAEVLDDLMRLGY